MAHPTGSDQAQQVRIQLFLAYRSSAATLQCSESKVASFLKAQWAVQTAYPLI